MKKLYLFLAVFFFSAAVFAQADVMEEDTMEATPASGETTVEPQSAQIPGKVEKNRIEFYSLPGLKRLKLKVETTDDVSGVRTNFVKINDGSFLPDQNKPFYLKRDGFYRIEWYSEDNVYNKSGHSVRNIYVDSTAPMIEQDIVGSKINKQNEVLEEARLALVATDSGIGVDKIEWKNSEAGQWQNYSTPIMLKENVGQYGAGTIHIRAQDKLGNRTSVLTFNFKLNSGPAVMPAFITDRFPEDAQPVHVPGEGIMVNEIPEGSTLEYKVDDGEFVPARSGERIQNLPPGEHTITWRYTDDLGRVIEKTYRILVDNDPPETILRPSIAE